MVKVSEFIIGLIFISFIMAILGLWMADLNQTYNLAYDNSSIESYNQLDEISELSEEVQDSTNIKEKTGVLDIIGGYFTSGYNALKLTAKSFNIFDTMSNQAIEDAHLGAGGNYLRIAVSATVLILIFLAVLISAIIKRDL